jgi:lipoprotein-anchoring transpeptidase ErfK/SrfK
MTRTWLVVVALACSASACGASNQTVLADLPTQSPSAAPAAASDPDAARVRTYASRLAANAGGHYSSFEWTRSTSGAVREQLMHEKADDPANPPAGWTSQVFVLQLHGSFTPPEHAQTVKPKTATVLLATVEQATGEVMDASLGDTTRDLSPLGPVHRS